MIESNYSLGSAGGHCSLCGGEFAAGDACISVLKEDAEAMFLRRDYCLSCWKNCDEEYFSFWRTKRCSGAAEPTIDEEALLPFYEGLSGREDRDSLELKYVLALYLAREKVLKLVDVRTGADGAENLVFEGPEKGRISCVRNPGLPEERMGELTRTIYGLFSCGHS